MRYNPPQVAIEKDLKSYRSRDEVADLGRPDTIFMGSSKRDQNEVILSFQTNLDVPHETYVMSHLLHRHEAVELAKTILEHFEPTSTQQILKTLRRIEERSTGLVGKV